MLDNLRKYNIVLASASPRRRELLERLGLRFTVRTMSGIDESYPPELKGADVARHICRKKAEAYAAQMLPDELVITADTIVLCEGNVLGKPADVSDAKHMLHQLSGCAHEVHTGVAVQTAGRCETFVVTTRVDFAELSDDEIDFYVETAQPLDKAGAYGIQEWIGLIAVERISGSYWNVMGLPVRQLYRVLKSF